MLLEQVTLFAKRYYQNAELTPTNRHESNPIHTNARNLLFHLGRRNTGEPVWEGEKGVDRFEAVESKLDLIGRTIQTAIDLIQSRRSLRVECYIVILIVFEIALTLYEMLIRRT